MVSLKKTFGIAFSFIGAVIGAGMMTGVEIIQYFGNGIYASFAVVFSCVFMALLLYIFISFCRDHDINCINEFGICLFGRYGRVFNAFISCTIIICAGGMLSGIGELFFDLLGIQPALLSISIALIGGILAYNGMQCIKCFNSFAIPFILLFILVVFLFNKENNVNNYSCVPIYRSIIFSFYNIAFALPLCCSEEKLNNSALFKALALFCILTSLAMIAISLLISNNNGGAGLPLYNAVKNISTSASVVYAISLFFASSTTYISAMVAFRKNKSNMILASLAALLISVFEIKNIVKYIYPFAGFLCIICLIRIIVIKVKV